MGAGKGASGQTQSTLWLALETRLTAAEIQLILQFPAGSSLSREGEQAGLSREGLGEDGLTGPPAPLGHWACADSPAHARKRRGVGGVGGARAGGWERARQARR